MINAGATRLVRAPLWAIPLGLVVGIVMDYFLFALLFTWFIYDPQ